MRTCSPRSRSGAAAVFVGRPVLWALACGGADGVRDLLTGLTDDLAHVDGAGRSRRAGRASRPRGPVDHGASRGDPHAARGARIACWPGGREGACESHRRGAPYARTWSTEAQPPRSEDIAYRERRYLIMMGIRVACFVADDRGCSSAGAGWFAAIPAVGAIVIPYFAVVFANGGREPTSTTGFPRLRTNLQNVTPRPRRAGRPAGRSARRGHPPGHSGTPVVLAGKLSLSRPAAEQGRQRQGYATRYARIRV